MKNLAVGTVIAYKKYDYEGEVRQTKFHIMRMEVNVEGSLPYVVMEGMEQFFENEFMVRQSKGTRYTSSNFIAGLRTGEITLE